MIEYKGHHIEGVHVPPLMAYRVQVVEHGHCYWTTAAAARFHIDDVQASNGKCREQHIEAKEAIRGG